MYSGQTTRSTNQEDKKIYRTDGTWVKFKGNEDKAHIPLKGSNF